MHVICGLGPPPIKNPGYAYASNTLFLQQPDIGVARGAQGARTPSLPPIAMPAMMIL